MLTASLSAVARRLPRVGRSGLPFEHETRRGRRRSKAPAPCVLGFALT